ncbi:MAG: hypothetical protein PWQ95_2011, partial [Thermococcaceae archaeon]|nr:hypothetical protein [Thermococcaceae archaeon]
ELSRVLALMKDSSYIERVEGEVLPLVEKLPESTRVGLFRRESPRKRVEDFAVLLTEGNLSGTGALRASSSSTRTRGLPATCSQRPTSLRP